MEHQEPVRSPTTLEELYFTIKAQTGEQAGYKHLWGHCPRCGRKIAISGDQGGKIICSCGAYLHFEPEAD